MTSSEAVEVETQAPNPDHVGVSLVPPLHGCVTLGKLLTRKMGGGRLHSSQGRWENERQTVGVTEQSPGGSPEPCCCEHLRPSMRSASALTAQRTAPGQLPRGRSNPWLVARLPLQTVWFHCFTGQVRSDPHCYTR